MNEGDNAHELDITELVAHACEKIRVSTVARCWIKASILPPKVQNALLAEYRNSYVRDDVRRMHVELERLICI